MFKIQTFCQVFLSSGTKNLKAKWIFYIICHLCVAKSYSQTQHLLYLELDGKLHLISFGHHILVVGQQGRKLARIIQASTEDMWDLFDQTLKQKRYHTSWPSFDQFLILVGFFQCLTMSMSGKSTTLASSQWYWSPEHMQRTWGM